MVSSIAIVIVLYDTKIYDSKTLISIKNIADTYDFSNFHFIIYDNNIEPQQDFYSFSLPLTYYHDKNNGGLATAYNYALNFCIEKNIAWLLLLDQDTDITKEYFSEIEITLPTNNQNEEVVVLLPQVLNNIKKISPVIIKRGGFIKEIDKNIQGVCNFPVTGINSASLLKVDFIKSIGGFNPVFKIDMLDYWYYQTIYKAGKKAYIMNSILQHNLSVMNYTKMSTELYENIIKAELIFFKNYCSIIDLFVFKLRLFLRIFKQLIKVKNKRICIITLKHLFL